MCGQHFALLKIELEETIQNTQGMISNASAACLVQSYDQISTGDERYCIISRTPVSGQNAAIGFGTARTGSSHGNMVDGLPRASKCSKCDIMKWNTTALIANRNTFSHCVSFSPDQFVN